MKTNQFFSIKFIKDSLFLLVGLFLGWLFFYPAAPEGHVSDSSRSDGTEIQKTTWTCAMHPQIRMDKPGQCPICGMDLIPLQNAGTEMDDQAIEMSESALKLAEVRTSVVGKGRALKDIRLYGKIAPDERLLQSQTAHFPGRIEQLMVNTTGEVVRPGQLIARIYSPDLLTAQKELLEAVSLGSQYPAILEAAREKLRLWKLTDDQVQSIETSGKVITTFDILANTFGIVVNRKVNSGDHIATGEVLFDVADLSTIWALFDAYETDLIWLSTGQTVNFTTGSIPGKTFKGKISFIDPIIETATRIARVRVEVANPDFKLKPEMFINGVVESLLKMKGEELMIPQSAVLWTGARAIVYIKMPDTPRPSFKMREITLGPALKDSYIILSGLSIGEEIVTNGTFSVDAAAQLAGKPSMMNPQGSIVLTGYNHDHQSEPTDERSEKNSGNGRGKMKKVVISNQAKIALRPLFAAYFELKEYLVQDNFEAAVQSGKTMKETLEQINMSVFSDDVYNIWMKYQPALKGGLQHIEHFQTIDEVRQSFMGISNALISLIESFGSLNGRVYVQHCPMANNNQGADWLSREKDVKNPYYGAAMLICGDVTETIQ